MTSWQERIDEAIRRPPIPEQRPTQESYLAEELRLERESERRNASQLAELIDRLKVADVLEALRKDVWKLGKVVPFERKEDRIQKRGFKLSDDKFRDLEVGVALIYRYGIPQYAERNIYKRKFKFWTWTSSGLSGLSDGVRVASTPSRHSSGPKRHFEFGFVNEMVGSEREPMEDSPRRERISVFVRRRLCLSPLNEPRQVYFDLCVHGEGDASSGMYYVKEFRIEPPFLDEERLKTLVDQGVLGESVERNRRKYFPLLIEDRIKSGAIPPICGRYLDPIYR